MNTKKIKLFLVDDDVLFLKSLEIEFKEHADFILETYTTGEQCLLHLSHNPDVIILDYHLDGIEKSAINGIETLDRIMDFDSTIPVVILSSQDKIEVAIDCMHHKAFDYVVKSETAFIRLQKIITTIFQHKKMAKTINWYMDRA
ncbi:MAG: response regulator [Bacteroidetes bacterium]|nr:response regulator [Bacteroidota bacterium]MBK9671671.1 response regulator [Bacteroidota bacterium]MBK9800565.1 response regulator [Bacteroidota bacterium]MBP6412101.1 response regulator [Bacteroidia bacterium]